VVVVTSGQLCLL